MHSDLSCCFDSKMVKQNHLRNRHIQILAPRLQKKLALYPDPNCWVDANIMMHRDCGNLFVHRGHVRRRCLCNLVQTIGLRSKIIKQYRRKHRHVHSLAPRDSPSSSFVFICLCLISFHSIAPSTPSMSMTSSILTLFRRRISQSPVASSRRR
jgi:hypothetical protein